MDHQIAEGLARPLTTGGILLRIWEGGLAGGVLSALAGPWDHSPRGVVSHTGGAQAAYAMDRDDRSWEHCNPLKSEPYGSGLSGISSHPWLSPEDEGSGP